MNAAPRLQTTPQFTPSSHCLQQTHLIFSSIILKMQIDAITLALFISSYYQYFGVAALKRSHISKCSPLAAR